MTDLRVALQETWQWPPEAARAAPGARLMRPSLVPVAQQDAGATDARAGRRAAAKPMARTGVAGGTRRAYAVG